MTTKWPRSRREEVGRGLKDDESTGSAAAMLWASAVQVQVDPRRYDTGRSGGQSGAVGPAVELRICVGTVSRLFVLWRSKYM